MARIEINTTDNLQGEAVQVVQNAPAPMLVPTGRSIEVVDFCDENGIRWWCCANQYVDTSIHTVFAFDPDGHQQVQDYLAQTAQTPLSNTPLSNPVHPF